MQKKKTIIALIVLVVLIAAAALAWHFFDPTKGADSSDKTVSITVTHGDGSVKSLCIATNAEFLRGALDQEKLVAGDESEYGLWIKTVDGETADESAQEWWCITKSGGELMTGVDMTPIADGESYELTLKTGW